MIEDKTVFVIGAGASANFNLPTGANLKNKIADLMTYKVLDRRNVKGRFERIFYQLKRSISAQQFELGDLNDALKAADEIREAMPLSQSIDNYLDAHRASSITNVLGKMAICQAIVESEADSNISGPNPSNIYNKLDFTRSESAWVNALLRKVTEGVPVDRVETLFQNVSIVTFNYDRCIEHFLYHALQRYYRLPERQVVSLIAGLDICHIYGKVGRLPWEAGNGPQIPYGDVSHDSLFETARHMFTFTEVEANSGIKSRVDGAFAGARRIVFLGFSFQEQNVAILPEVENEVVILGTAKGMSDTNLAVVQEKLHTHFSGAGSDSVSQVVLEKIGAEVFIDNYWRVIE